MPISRETYNTAYESLNRTREFITTFLEAEVINSPSLVKDQARDKILTIVHEVINDEIDSLKKEYVNDIKNKVDKTDTGIPIKLFSFIPTK